MAVSLKSSYPFFLCLILLCGANCTEFEVGGREGWVVPKTKDDAQMFNQWASQNRFRIDDTLLFKYEKDSVMEVTKEKYENCLSPHPLFFSNNGDTVFKFDRAGFFYFISGVRVHCDRGQKMIIKVLDIEATPSPQSANDTAPKPHSKNGVAELSPMRIMTGSTVFVMSTFLL